MDQPTSIKILYPREFPLLFAKCGRRTRLTVCVYLRLKAEYAAHSRFNDTDKGWNEAAGACGYGTKYFSDAVFEKLQEEKLAWKEGQYIVLASWDQLKAKFGYSRNFHIAHELEGSVSSKQIMVFILKDFCRLMKAEYTRNYKFNINRNPDLKSSLKNVSMDPTRENISYCQLKAFTQGFPTGIDDDVDYSMYMLLKAKKEARNGGKRFYIKADTNISTQHYSELLGYARKNGFCYYKKKMKDLGLIAVIRREYVIENGLRTTIQERLNNIGTVFFDHKSRQTKLRMVDEMIFLNVFSLRLPVLVQAEPEPDQGQQTPLAA